jgi:hypothetical protein
MTLDVQRGLEFLVVTLSLAAMYIKLSVDGERRERLSKTALRAAHMLAYMSQDNSTGITPRLIMEIVEEEYPELKPIRRHKA